VAIVEVAAVEYREALQSVRRMLERAGSAKAVELEELRARRAHVLAIAARGASFAEARGLAAPPLSPDVESLLARIATELVEASAAAPAPATTPAAA
jgi:hypothetical protein